MSLHVATTNVEQPVWEGDPERLGQGCVETILFVEDEAFVRNVTREVLLSAGYVVLTANDAAEASILFSSNHTAVSLLLTDVILPGETGRALAAALRKENPKLCVLFVTGYMEQMADYKREGIGFLAKPFSAAGLLAKVREVLDGQAEAA